MRIFILQLIYYGSYLLVGYTLYVTFRKLRRGHLLGTVWWLGLSLLFVRARFIEPNIIQVQEEIIDVGFEKNLVLIADIHLGVYKKTAFLQHVVDKINKLDDIDAVFIAGDFTYDPVSYSVSTLTDMFAPLADIQVPVLAVLGNHDTQAPGVDLKKPLLQALNTHGVIYLHNDRYRLDGVTIVGLGPHLSKDDDVSILNSLNIQDDIIILTHNPDTTLQYTNQIPDLTVVGHTHCGQVRLPIVHDILRPYIYPVVGDFDCGLLDLGGHGQLYITPGLGEVMLPVRFRNPPTISVLHLR